MKRAVEVFMKSTIVANKSFASPENKEGTVLLFVLLLILKDDLCIACWNLDHFNESFNDQILESMAKVIKGIAVS
jgi:hypothetical protein